MDLKAYLLLDLFQTPFSHSCQKGDLNHIADGFTFFQIWHFSCKHNLEGLPSPKGVYFIYYFWDSLIVTLSLVMVTLLRLKRPFLSSYSDILLNKESGSKRNCNLEQRETWKVGLNFLEKLYQSLELLGWKATCVPFI